MADGTNIPDVAMVDDEPHDTGMIKSMDKMFREKVTMIDGKKRAPRNVLTRMEALGQSEGPFSILQRSVTERLKVRVWTRNYRHIHGISTGYVIAYDKHMNLVLQDVDELYKNPIRDEQLQCKVKRKRIRKKKTKSTNPMEVSSDVKSKCVDSRDSVVSENKLESPTLNSNAHSLTRDTQSLHVSEAATGDQITAVQPSCDRPDDDDDQIKELLRQMNEITQQLNDLSSSDDRDENDSERDELCKDNRPKTNKESDIENSRRSDVPDLCKIESFRAGRRERDENPRGLRDDNVRRDNSREDKARDSKQYDEKHSAKNSYRNDKSNKKLDRKVEDENAGSFTANERTSAKNTKKEINSRSSENDRRACFDVRPCTQNEESFPSDTLGNGMTGTMMTGTMMTGTMMTGTVMTGTVMTGTIDVTSANKSLLSRHVNQLLVRGDNVVMVAIVTS